MSAKKLIVRESSFPTIDEEGKRRYDWLTWQEYNRDRQRKTKLWE